LCSEDYNTSKYEHLATSAFHRPNNKSKKPANSKPSWMMLYHSTRLNEFRFSLGHLTPRLKQVTTKAHLVVQAPPRSSAAAFLLSFGIGQSHKYLQEWCTPTPHKLFRSHVLRFNDVTVHFWWFFQSVVPISPGSVLAGKAALLRSVSSRASRAAPATPLGTRVSPQSIRWQQLPLMPEVHYGNSRDRLSFWGFA
jgi:hypothetical protein